ETMSGFAAVVPPAGAPADRALVERTAGFLSFRGPDGTCARTLDGCGLACSLLRTGDRPEPAAGPFSLDPTLHVVCDARLDARPDLLRDLRGAGVAADAGASAAELIARAYRAWGRDCVHHLVGDFAFAVWDAPARRLFCARDPLGVKLLYRASPPGGGFICSNTLECVRLHPGVRDELDEVAVADFLVRSVQLDRDRTIRRDVRILPPGHTLTVEDGRVRVEPYWRWPADPPLRLRRVGEYVEQFIDLFATAVRERTPPGGVGVMMSGGLDSTSVAAMAVDAVAADGAGVRAFTARSSGLLREEEGRYASVTAETLGIPVTWLDVDGYRAFERCGGDPLLDRPEPVDGPFLAGQVDQWLQAAEHARVLLTGFGGDAVLRETPSRLIRLAAGGHLLRAAAEAVQYARLHRRIPRPGVRTWLRRNDPPPATVIPDWIDPAFARRVGLRERMEAHRTPAAPAHPRHPEALEMLAEPLWPNLFASLDPGATRIPLEIRHPLFDVRLIRFLLSIPPAQWYNDKGLPRLAMKGRLPGAVLRRPKSPLPDDPLEVRRRAHGDGWLGGRTLGPEVAPWVDVSRVPAIAGGRAQGPGEPLWRNLRPLSLSVWLRGAGGGAP
ncbi:MAG TPA: asparagine synthase-related protein, partial [Longimicrobium sp.]|nr:asparagine synthase-related protein [Longimicrobium sp.]